MKKRRYTARLLSMAVAANLVFSSLAMPVFSADLSGLETELSTEMQGETETTVSVKETETETREETESQAETVNEMETETQAMTETDSETVTETEVQTETASQEIEKEIESTQEIEAQADVFSARENASAVQAGDPVEITVQNGEVTSKTTSLTVNLSGVPSSGILRVVQLDAGDTYDAGKLNDYTSLHFSVLSRLHTGENVLSLTGAPTPGKQLLVVVRDAGGSIVDYVSSPILVAEEQTEPDPGQEKTPEEILKNTSVTLLKNGEARTENFTQQETSVDVRVKLDDSVDKCWLKICGYAGNTGFDPDSNFNKVLWSGWVTNGFEGTLSFAESQLPLPVGYDIIACLNVRVGDDFYRSSLSQSLEVVD